MLAFLHTSPVHVETFGPLARQLGESVPVRHEVRADLLAAALVAGVSPEFVRSAVSDVLHGLARDGAKVILCTCSTICIMVASDEQRSPDIAEVLCQPAWALFEQGDVSGYMAVIANTIDSTAIAGDLVFLSQASMAPVAELVNRSDISIVSSPRPGIEAAIAAHRRLK